MGNDPVEKAKATLGEAWKAARGAAEGVKKEIERAGIARSLEDVGREIARATTNVAGHLGTELEELGREIRLKAEGTAASGANEPPPATPGATQAGGAPPTSSPAQGATQAGARPPTDEDRPGRGGEPPTEGPGATPGGRGGVRIATD